MTSLAKRDSEKIKKLQAVLRRERKELRAKAVELTRAVTERDQYKMQMGVLHVQLAEARRRTVPLGPDGRGGTYNFLPEYISEVKVRQDSEDHVAMDGSLFTTTGPREAVLHCFGEVVHHKKEEVR